MKWHEQPGFLRLRQNLQIMMDFSHIAAAEICV